MRAARPTQIVVEVFLHDGVGDGSTVSTLTGSGEDGFTDGAAAEAQFSYPAGVAVAADGSVLVIDAGKQRIRKIAPVV